MNAFCFTIIMMGSLTVYVDLGNELDLTVTTAQKGEDERKEENEEQCNGRKDEKEENDDNEDEDHCESFFKKRSKIFFEIDQIKKVTQEDMRIFHDTHAIGRSVDDFAVKIDEQETFEDHMLKTEKELSPNPWKYAFVEK